MMTGAVKLLKVDVHAKPMSVIYLKLGLDRNDLDSYPGSVRDHARKHRRFPQDPTRNQSFAEEQFMAYRDLGSSRSTQAWSNN